MLLVSVLLSLVFAQGLGAMHRVLHAPRIAASVLAGMAAPVHAGASVIEALFAGHDTAHACDQYDQLNHADLACGAHADFTAADVVALPVTLRPGWQLAAQAAGFLARGPPAQA